MIRMIVGGGGGGRGRRIKIVRGSTIKGVHGKGGDKQEEDWIEVEEEDIN